MNFNQNYFEILGLPLVFDVDLGLLSDRFLELQKEVHPDRFASRPEQEKRLAMQWATLLNSANDTLKSPLKRAIYLLQLKGIELEDNPRLPPEFLMEQIELREQLEDIEGSEANLDDLAVFKKEVKAVIRSIEQNFSKTIEDDLVQAETLVYEMQFLSKLLASANQLEEKLLDY